jgi:DUF4097 and DUF4098 domain-containing protein YvlB
MRRAIGPILGLLLLIEIGVAVAIVLATPDGFGGILNLNIGPERRQEQAVQTFELNGQAGNLVINSAAGHVTIESSSTATAISINATKIIHSTKDEDFNRLIYQVTQNGNTINVTAKPEQLNGPTFRFNERVDISITTPRNVAANVKTGSGDVQLSGLENREQSLNIETGSGSVNATNIQGGTLKVKTGSGEVSLSTVTSGLDVDSGSGAIRVTNSNVTALRLNTGSGEIRFNGQATINADTQVSTGSGSIQLEFNNLGTTPPRFDVSTGSGNINFNVKGISVAQNDKHRVTTGNSGPLLRVNTGSGDVRITG